MSHWNYDPFPPEDWVPITLPDGPDEIFFTEGPHKGMAVPRWLMSRVRSGDRVKYVTIKDVGTWYLNDTEVVE